MSGDARQTGASGMANTLRRREGRFALCLIAWSLILWIAAAALAQTPPGPPVVRVFHPQGLALSYDVATIKPSDPGQPYAGTTLRRYIANAYGVPIPWGVPGVEFPGAQVLGGPAWIDNDKYDIKGQAPDELRASMEKLSADDRRAQTETMQQALLAERFHLKVHFETREMPIFELVPAKGGLKIKPNPVDPPPAGSAAKPFKPGDPLPPGTMALQVRLNGASTLEARADDHGPALPCAARPVPGHRRPPHRRPDRLPGHLRCKGLPLRRRRPPSTGRMASAPSRTRRLRCSKHLEQQLGLEAGPREGPVEVVVIDSIDRPTDELAHPNKPGAPCSAQLYRADRGVSPCETRRTKHPVQLPSHSTPPRVSYVPVRHHARQLG